MSQLTRTESVGYNGIYEHLLRLQAGEVAYHPPQPDLTDSTPFQSAINSARKQIRSHVAGACGYGQSLTYYALQEFGSIHLHQIADLYLHGDAHAFLVLEMEEKLLLIDITFRQFIKGNFFAFPQEAAIYDHLLKYGWVELQEDTISAFCYAVHGSRSDIPLPSLDAFRHATVAAPDHTTEEIAKYHITIR